MCVDVGSPAGHSRMNHPFPSSPYIPKVPCSQALAAPLGSFLRSSLAVYSIPDAREQLPDWPFGECLTQKSCGPVGCAVAAEAPRGAGGISSRLSAAWTRAAGDTLLAVAPRPQR